MSERICHLCGKPATGWASSWTANEGERWYCHGDDDESPTCYERHEWDERGTAATNGVSLLERVIFIPSDEQETR